jgi:hypothetical protein
LKNASHRKPAAYLTREAWLQGVPFYVDERAIVPRSFIAELLADGSIDGWLSDQTPGAGPVHRQRQPGLLAAMAWPEVQVTGADISPTPWPWPASTSTTACRSACLRVRRPGRLPGPWDLILCNPPYVNADSMAPCPPNTAPSPSWPWPAAPTAWTSSAAAGRARAHERGRRAGAGDRQRARTSRPPSPVRCHCQACDTSATSTCREHSSPAGAFFRTR